MEATGSCTTPILDRSDDNRRRKNRLKQMKRGPGVFVYEGGHRSVDFVPTIKTKLKQEPVVDEDGALVTDEQGRPQYKTAGIVPVLDHRGQHQMGGIPKRVTNEHDEFSMPGWSPLVFEINKPARVVDAPFALKLRCLGVLRELEGAELEAFEAGQAEPEAPKAKRGRKAKSELSEASTD